MHSENKTLVKKCDWSMIRHASAGLFDGINKAEDETHMSPRDIFDRQFKFADEYMRLAYLYPLVNIISLSGGEYGSEGEVGE